MKPQEQRRWSAAKNLAELGELTALWLEGELEETPGHGGPPAEETRPFVPILAATNRAGAVTVNSQPGEDEMIKGGQWLQRATVDFLLPHEIADSLSAAAARRGLIVIRHGAAPATTDMDISALVTLNDGEPYTWSGRPAGIDQLRYEYEYCSPELIAEVLQAEQVALIEPEWGPSTRVWDLLSNVREWSHG
jgi:hypothetical protein